MNPAPAPTAYATELIARREMGLTSPPAPARKVSPYKRHKSATHYLEGEEQREKKALMQANEAVIVGMLMLGMPVPLLAACFGVTDEAIHKRRRAYGIIPAARPSLSESEVTQLDDLIV